MTGHKIIIQVLKEKEASLLSELHQVQRAIHDLLKEHSDSLFHKNDSFNALKEAIPVSYEDCKTYNNKVLFILSSSSSPMLVTEIIEEIIKAEPQLEEKKLRHNVAYSIGLLTRSKRVQKHGFNRCRKYSI